MATDTEKLLEAAKAKRLKFMESRDWVRRAAHIGAKTPIHDAKILSFDTLIQTLEEVARNG